ncbi:FecR family protein [bacterium A37T11]|nr:FecR family protein [bacterium A37T11]
MGTEGMTKKEAELLIDKYLAGTCTPEEKALVEKVYNLTSSQESAIISKEELLEERKALYAKLRRSHTTTLQAYIKVAALLIAAIAIGLYFYQSTKNQPIIAPGYNQATLTLADGTKIALDSAQSGIVVNDENIKYSNGNNVLAKKGRGSGAPGKSHQSGEMLNQVQHDALLQLSTPKGGQYQVILPDGTKVWLNAASTLKYPSKFTGDRREVVLEGEAYFEVNNNPSIGAMQDNRKSYVVNRKSNSSFIVKSRNQEITVLGTTFNVTAFNDEKETKTTLIEGKVQVRSENLQRKTFNVKLLSPHQQAVVKGDSLTVSKVDVERISAWKNGYFKFDGNIHSIMDQISRWYDVAVVYSSGVNQQVELIGNISRYKNLGEVLEALEATGKVHFRVENADKAERRVLVMP